jgi:prepilin-type processing-associated H-X9-DG protein
LINTQYQWSNIWVATTNYRGVMGSNQMIESTSSCPTQLPKQQFCNDGRTRCNGLIWRTSSQFPIRLRQVTDVTGQTMLIGEDLPSHDWHTMWSFSNGDSSSTYCPLNFRLNTPDPESWWDMRGFRSYHQRGANFAFADASVQFIFEEVDFDLYKAMSTAGQQDGVD